MATPAPGHALLMLVALGASLLLERVLPAAVVCAASLGSWAWLQRGETWRRGVGAADAVTSLRVLLLLCLAALVDLRMPLAAAMCSIVIFALDGLDGWLARRLGTASAFGAYYDMETDSGFVLVLSIGLLRLGHAGAWILLAGALRYLYVVTLWLARRSHADAPRSRFGRYVFAVVVLAFVLDLWPAGPTGRGVAAGAMLLLCWSFARSFYWSLRSVDHGEVDHRAQQRQEQ